MAGVIEDDGREIQWPGFLREIQRQTMIGFRQTGFRQGFEVDKVSTADRSRSKPANADPKEMEKVSADDDRVSKSTRFQKWKRKPTRGTDEGEKKTPTRGTRETEKKETLTRSSRETEGQMRGVRGVDRDGDADEGDEGDPKKKKTATRAAVEIGNGDEGATAAARVSERERERECGGKGGKRKWASDESKAARVYDGG